MSRYWMLLALISSCERHEEPVWRVDTPSPQLVVEPDLGDPPADMVQVPAGSYHPPCEGGSRAWCMQRTKFVEEFYIDRLEVTVADYKHCVDRGACKPLDLRDTGYCRERSNYAKPGHDRHPINCVSFSDAESYCHFRGKQLPKRDEWWKAAIGTEGWDFPWGNTLPTCEQAVMNSRNCPHDDTEPVGSRSRGASPYGALDMSGNLAEIIDQYFDGQWASYGGSFLETELDLYARSGSVKGRSPTVGFRCVRYPSAHAADKP